MNKQLADWRRLIGIRDDMGVPHIDAFLQAQIDMAKATGRAPTLESLIYAIKGPL